MDLAKIGEALNLRHGRNCPECNRPIDSAVWREYPQLRGGAWICLDCDRRFVREREQIARDVKVALDRIEPMETLWGTVN